MPKKLTIDHSAILSIYEETQSNRKTAQRLGIHENTVLKVRRERDGKCVRCGQAPAAEGGKNCEPCQEWARKNMQERRAKRPTIGVCLQCTKPIEPPSRMYCADHREYNRRRGHDQRQKNQARLGEEYFARQREWNRKQKYGEGAVKVFKESQGTCAICQAPYKKRKIHLHHKDGSHDNRDETNFVTLCDTCHHAIHAILTLSKHPNRPLLLDWMDLTYPGLLASLMTRDADRAC